MSYFSSLYDRGWGVGQEVFRTITPARFRADLERTRAAVDGLARDVAAYADRLDGRWLAGWQDFVSRWGAFVADHPPSGDLASSFLSSSYDVMMGYAEELGRWRASADAAGVARVGPDVEPRPAQGPLQQASSSPLTWALVGGGIVLGLAWLFGGRGGGE